MHSLHRLIEIAAMGGDLHQQRIKVGRNHRAAESAAAVQSNAKTRRRSVAGEAAVIGDEIIFRVFGGDARLNGHAARLDLLLHRNVDRRFVQLISPARRGSGS